MSAVEDALLADVTVSVSGGSAAPEPEEGFLAAGELDTLDSLAGPTGDPALDIAADPPLDEMDRLEELPTGPVQLPSGMELEIVPMNLRETMKLLKIVTHGAGPILSQQFSSLDFDDPDDFAQALLGILIMSIGDAETELIEFLQSMCQPVGFDNIKDPKKRAEVARQMLVELYNPSTDITIAILGRIVSQEAENLRGLGKKIGALTRALRARSVARGKTRLTD